MTTKLTGGEAFWYYLTCFLTFGSLYFIKIAAKKAICEANAEMLGRQYLTIPKTTE